MDSDAAASSGSDARVLAKELQVPPKKQGLLVAESRGLPFAGEVNGKLFRGAGGNPGNLEVRKPSLSLELPRFGGYQNFVADQEAQETEDREGYAYPKPEADTENLGYAYPTPSARLPEDETEEPPTESPIPPVRKKILKIINCYINWWC